MISNESYQLIHGLLGSRRDQEACNVKNALKSEGYQRGNQTMIEYVEQKRKSVKMCQQAIDELKRERELHKRSDGFGDEAEELEMLAETLEKEAAGNDE